MKAVIYARYSSDNQREESIEGQIRECSAFAEKNGITILRHYIDRAFSAKTDNRPEFQNMIKDSGKRLFDMIIVWKLDRFARNRYDSARYKAALKKNGVKVVSATEVISDGAEGIILESVLEGYAEYYSADLSEKVVRGMTENALKSKYNGGTRPIGYLIDGDQRFQPDPLTAPFVREADTAIQNLLNAIQQGILTKSTKSRLEELEAAKEELETKIACEKLAKPKVSAEFMMFWLQRFRKLDVRQKSHRKMLIDTFVNAIFLYDDKMVITFNYKDGTDTITFDDLKTALVDKKTGSDLDCSTAPSPENIAFSGLQTVDKPRQRSIF